MYFPEDSSLPVYSVWATCNYMQCMSFGHLVYGWAGHSVVQTGYNTPTQRFSGYTKPLCGHSITYIYTAWHLVDPHIPMIVFLLLSRQLTSLSSMLKWVAQQCVSIGLIYWVLFYWHVSIVTHCCAIVMTFVTVCGLVAKQYLYPCTVKYMPS